MQQSDATHIIPTAVPPIHHALRISRRRVRLFCDRASFQQRRSYVQSACQDKTDPEANDNKARFWTTPTAINKASDV